MKKFLIIILFPLSVHAQYYNSTSGSMSVGGLPLIVNALTDVSTANKIIGVRAYCTCDSSEHLWTGTQWLSIADSLRVKSLLTAAGNISASSGIVRDYLSNVSTFTPATGATIALVKGTNLVNPAGTLLTLTTTFPTSPSEGDIFRTVFTKTITTLTMSSPATINNLLTTILAAGVCTYQYVGGAWYKL